MTIRRAFILCGAGRRAESYMRSNLSDFDRKESPELYLLADQSPADKMPHRWCMDVGAPYKIFRTKMTKETLWAIQCKKRDLEIFELGQPDIVLAFRGTKHTAGARYEFAVEMARERGITVLSFGTNTIRMKPEVVVP